jgi:type IV pilus assembly protein PilZ
MYPTIVQEQKIPFDFAEIANRLVRVQPEGPDSMEENSSDRREFLRRPIELQVEYKRLNTFFADYTRNISKGGTFIRTERPLDIGTEFVFALRVPAFEEPLRFVGKVQWVTPVEGATEEQPPGMGIEFVYENDEERLKIEQLVEQLMVTQLGESLSTRLLGRPVQ